MSRLLSLKHSYSPTLLWATVPLYRAHRPHDVPKASVVKSQYASGENNTYLSRSIDESIENHKARYIWIIGSTKSITQVPKSRIRRDSKPHFERRGKGQGIELIKQAVLISLPAHDLLCSENGIEREMARAHARVRKL